MRHLSIVLIVAALATPAVAEENEFSEGFDLLGQGTRLLMEGLMEEFGPALDGLRQSLSDLDAYHPPEILPNGDIIIRRKTPADIEFPEDGVEL